MSQDMSDTECNTTEQINDILSHTPQQPIKIRKKPGRKPNPASPALRKAQNRAAQRAFRERKERHMRELEIAIKQIREQRDKLHSENEQFKADQEIMRSENWYLKGIVLTLQLVCFQHNLVIPQHGPYINEQALTVLAQSIPESISTYISVNANNKLPIPPKLFGHTHTMKQRDRYLSSGSIVITKGGIHAVPDVCNSPQQETGDSTPAPMTESTPTETSTTTLEGTFSPDVPTDENLVHPFDERETSIPPLSPGSVRSDSESRESPILNSLHTNSNSNIPKPVMLTEEPLTSNLAAVQALRLRLRLQSACVRMDAAPFAIQPTILQLTIPHDPRIDLIPTAHMRDRMILFRDQFDLDDCFRCLLGHSVFHGGDPAVAANWQLPPEFFEKYWFLTIDYDLRRTTNKWRRLQGLNDLDFKQQQQQADRKKSQPDLEGPPTTQKLDFTDLSALLGIDFWKIAQQKCTPSNKPVDTNDDFSYASSLSSSNSFNSNHSALQVPPTAHEEDSADSFQPVRLTNGYTFPPKISKEPSHQKSPAKRHHPYQKPTTSKPSVTFTQDLASTCDPWDTLLIDPLSNTGDDYDMLDLNFY
ncbi:hypothetical protein INT47_012350 [Mucor saturninus]|uniref:BZIP domain-containing protein n=1 Tax=Mucor saturninus TaxID=64648 RepID=A0A8H7QXE4_9FUNG|nr:hypothetical protein INT47_012350 [Mucor saturninus]